MSGKNPGSQIADAASISTFSCSRYAIKMTDSKSTLHLSFSLFLSIPSQASGAATRIAPGALAPLFPLLSIPVPERRVEKTQWRFDLGGWSASSVGLVWIDMEG